MKPSSAIKNENADSEKQVNKLNNILVSNNFLKTFLFLFFIGNVTLLQAQERLPFDQGTKYILADVDVTGKITFNKQTVVTFAGLEKGQEITIPGEEISNAIKKLGKLGLFNKIDFYVNQIKGDSIYLELNINELPKLSDVKITGVKKNKVEDLIKEGDLTKGKIVNENLITTTKNYFENKYKKDGYFNTKVAINTVNDTTVINQVKMIVNIDKGDKLKISKIDFTGNTKFSDKKLRKAMKNTKTVNPIRIFKSSKFIKEKYKEDLTSIADKYKEQGYRDARIVSDSVWLDKSKNKIAINVKVEEGNKYYFGDIKFLGNTVYSDQFLKRVLAINKGDTYNGVLLEKRIADKSKPDGDDITNLYQNNGYLFSNVNAVEVKTENDSINFEIRVVEGPLAYFNRVTVSGNDKTNDRVIYRELRTKPGEKWNKEEVISTIRELGQLGFFDPEAISPDVKNADPVAGTVDLDWKVVEKGSSQIELQGGYGGGGFIGTLGLSFNNFSVRNMFKKEAYRPVPMGDGQKVSLRAQASSFFQTYSLSFSEPWFGGKKPVSFSTSLSHSKQFLYTGSSSSVNRDKSFNITSLSVGLGKRLTVPDNYFYLSNAISFQYYDLNNYNTGLFTFGNGSSRNLAYTFGITRNNKGNSPIFPTKGSEFSLTAKFTPPYSLFNKVDYAELENKKEYKVQYTGDNFPYETVVNADGEIPGPGDYLVETENSTPNNLIYETVGDDYESASTDRGKVDQKKFNWLEYYKVKFKAESFSQIYEKLTLRTLGEFGFLGAYNSDRGLVPFERFFVGGDGLANFALDGREVVQLRGYPNQSLSSTDGDIIYNKFSLELRYPITMKSQASIYVLGFLEAGSSFNSFKNYNPFQLQRSAGFGLRVFMPAFGLLGIDFGHGFDAIPGSTVKNGWETHFIIGQQF
ncbi:outer membrane protein assembly factor BamA [Flavobacterium aquatile]|uniref:Outer membrane protein assembly factor BamA n=1 Tax=Flavobacterium aquatile LMG 4008 = ATCC 11947 TaxID=1453498 RepID=A0A095SXC5_9FLAO|nr:outer membrane protein assembly factor BamA [Flavobacterium aquatile]KGD69212.1 membrane protein [Flavobacterium aquatile LMG 4008 = ATCC 11947]OXA69573.1 outer membrane protein assembly factor BamA [Flavobacterium aquatile LMG 4008 = ATCC 11947]GEC79797.1 outer membrane protein assembly factor BamA [Flavobacterium aquatile]